VTPTDVADSYAALPALLDDSDAEYELIEHAPVGATEAVSVLRGHPLEQAAKCNDVDGEARPKDPQARTGGRAWR
jgi:Ala-tRNA(Pro) deacylase